MDDDLLRDLDDLDDATGSEEEEAQDEVEIQNVEEALLASVAGARDIQGVAKLARSKTFQETLRVCCCLGCVA
jgi:hypothetical protein